jgi:ribosomal-protein-alanine N-acetyltransferase
MAFLRSVTQGDVFDPVDGERVTLRFPRAIDFDEWARLREASRNFLTPWEPTWASDELTRGAYRRRLRRYADDIRADHAYAFFAFLRGNGALVGGLTLSGVRRGVTQSCSLGYWMGEAHAGRGLMTDAVRAIVPYVFETLRLHRLEAACLPTNEPSKRLLRRVGFTEEGYARQYLRIDGAWRDHVLFAMLESDPRPR